MLAVPLLLTTPQAEKHVQVFLNYQQTPQPSSHTSLFISPFIQSSRNKCMGFALALECCWCTAFPCCIWMLLSYWRSTREAGWGRGEISVGGRRRLVEFLCRERDVAQRICPVPSLILGPTYLLLFAGAACGLSFVVQQTTAFTD